MRRHVIWFWIRILNVELVDSAPIFTPELAAKKVPFGIVENLVVTVQLLFPVS
jgi:hypothetical protein